MREIRYLVVHTAAYSGPNCDADLIRRWHVEENGWDDIGYHAVILNDRHDTKRDGTVELGREESIVGAHCRGINHNSLGLCFVGHHDVEILTDAQTLAAVQVLTNWVERYELPFTSIVGHSGINDLIRAGEVDPKYRTEKTCPGERISVPMLRGMVLHEWIRRRPGQGHRLYPR